MNGYKKLALAAAQERGFAVKECPWKKVNSILFDLPVKTKSIGNFSIFNVSSLKIFSFIGIFPKPEYCPDFVVRCNLLNMLWQSLQNRV